jgi:hypothetical protein
MIPPPSTEERDQQLAQLLVELSEQRRRGLEPDVNTVAAQHPDLAAELRELWGAVLLAWGRRVVGGIRGKRTGDRNRRWDVRHHDGCGGRGAVARQEVITRSLK